jgi:signal transduction histidine kinase
VTSLVYETGGPARIDYHDVSGTIGQVAARDWGLQSSVGVPVSIESRLWGSLAVAFGHEELLPADTEERLANFCELVGTAIANAEATAEVTASRARIVAAGDQARRRIERDLHDGAQQRLVSLALQLRQAQEAVPPRLGELNAQLDRAVAEARAALDEVGEIAGGVHPAMLARGGLRPAIRVLAHRSPSPVRIDACTDRRLPEHIEVTVYYVVAEALTNAAKHARASEVSVQVEIMGKVLLIAVRDDGIGDVSLSRGTGLAGLKDRVEALGGLMLIDSPRGGGTSLRVELPLTPSRRVVTAEG